MTHSLWLSPRLGRCKKLLPCSEISSILWRCTFKLYLGRMAYLLLSHIKGSAAPSSHLLEKLLLCGAFQSWWLLGTWARSGLLALTPFGYPVVHGCPQVCTSGWSRNPTAKGLLQGSVYDMLSSPLSRCMCLVPTLVAAVIALLRGLLPPALRAPLNAND